MTVQGTASAAAASVAIPTHQVGDLIWVFTIAASNTAPAKPAAAGTVPNWTVPQAGGANSVALSSAWALATANNHTTGTWTNATQICVIVFRPSVGKMLGVGGTNTNNSSSTLTIVYPNVTLVNATGTSWGLRCGTRSIATVEVGNPPTAWTNQIVQPAGASALMAVHTWASITSLTGQIVNMTGTSAPFRAHSLEITERPAQQAIAAII